MYTKHKVVVEKNIPYPKAAYGKRERDFSYPFAKMEKGDSFAIEIPARYKGRIGVFQSSIMTTARSWALYNRKPNHKFSTRKEGEMRIRLWRIK